MPTFRSGIDPLWVEQKGGMGYPIVWSVNIPALVSLIVLCAANAKDAAKLSAANFVGIVWLGFLSMSPDYIEPCTHDAVLAAAWTGGVALCERSRPLRYILWGFCAAMALGVGEVWHALGGSWCPLRESEKVYGVFWSTCAGFLCSLSVFARMIGSRLGVKERAWRVWLASGLLSLGLFGAMANGVAYHMFGKFEGGELGLMYGLMLPLSGLCVNLVLSLWAVLGGCKRSIRVKQACRSER